MKTFLPAIAGLALAFTAFGVSQGRIPLETFAPFTTLITQPLILPAATPHAPSIMPQIAAIEQLQTDQDRQVANLLDQIAGR